MLPLVGEEIESANSANREIDVNLEAWREQQACQQRKTAPPRMDPAVCHVRGSNGKKHPAQLCSVPFLSHMHRFYRRHVNGAMARMPFAEELADYFFHRHLLNVDIAHITCFEQLPAGFSNFGAGNFQLH